jgi:hypothetical protein
MQNACGYRRMCARNSAPYALRASAANRSGMRASRHAASRSVSSRLQKVKRISPRPSSGWRYEEGARHGRDSDLTHQPVAELDVVHAEVADLGQDIVGALGNENAEAGCGQRGAEDLAAGCIVGGKLPIIRLREFEGAHRRALLRGKGEDFDGPAYYGQAGGLKSSWLVVTICVHGPVGTSLASTNRQLVGVMSYGMPRQVCTAGETSSPAWLFTRFRGRAVPKT